MKRAMAGLILVSLLTASALAANEVTLTLYVHEGSPRGRVLAGVRMTGSDAAGHRFSETTGRKGYVRLTGTPGTWRFLAYKDGYDRNAWAQSIRTTCTRHAFLNPTRSSSDSANSEPPRIAGISPSQPEAKRSRQILGIQGRGFVKDSRVVLRIKGNTYPIPRSRTRYLSSTQLKILAGLTDPGRWSVQVVNPGGRSSNVMGFTVAEAKRPERPQPKEPRHGEPESVTLRLYVHEGNPRGRVLSGVRVEGKDAAGKGFSGRTRGSGYVMLSGQPGRWEFAAAKEGYSEVSWKQPVTRTRSLHAFLKPAPQPSRRTEPRRTDNASVAPQVTGISPSQPEAKRSRQTLTLRGKGFVADSRVVLRIKGNTYPIPRSRTRYLSSTQLKILAGLTDPGRWSVQVVNPGGRALNVLPFTVKAKEKAEQPRPQESGPKSAKPYIHAPHPKNAFNWNRDLVGFCTWYAADRWLWAGNSNLPSTSDAVSWIEDARDRGLHVDRKKPIRGSIVVFGPTNRNRAGHVAYVESVGSRNYVISQMNAGNKFMQGLKTELFGQVTKDTLKVGQSYYRNMRVLGFIYPERSQRAPHQIALQPKPANSKDEAIRQQVAALMKAADALEKKEQFAAAVERLEAVRAYDRRFWPKGFEERLNMVRQKQEALKFFGTGRKPKGKPQAPTSRPSLTGAARITDISPSQPEAKRSRQILGIQGRGFVKDSRVVLRIKGNAYPIPRSRTRYLSSTQLKILAGLTDPGRWSVQVVNPGGRSSNVMGFTVQAAPTSSAHPNTASTRQPSRPPRCRSETRPQEYGGEKTGASSKRPPRPQNGGNGLLHAAKKFIRRHEGCKTNMYRDSKGHPTVGVGFNLDRPDARRRLQGVGADYEKVYKGIQALTAEQIDSLFEQDVADAIRAARQGVDSARKWAWHGKTYPKCTTFDMLPQEAKLVAVDMAFNVGSGEFLSMNWGGIFQMPLGEAAEYIRTAPILAGWRSQVKRRGDHLVNTLSRAASPRKSTREQAESISLTLYVHEEEPEGPFLSGTRVRGKDGAGKQFDKRTNDRGYVTITGAPGLWVFQASKDDYETNTWRRRIMSSSSLHAFLEED